MNKNSLFDDVARTLASPIPRRRACAQILRGLGVAALASLGIPQTALAAKCDPKKGETQCGPDKCCKKAEQCCGKTCCGKSDKCCGDKCCGNGRECCNGVCCKGGEECVGGKCVKPQTKSKTNPNGR
jgi:hypothetical protein